MARLSNSLRISLAFLLLGNVQVEAFSPRECILALARASGLISSSVENRVLPHAQNNDLKVTVVSEKELGRIFKALVKSRVLALTSRSDGCWANAHYITHYLEKNDIESVKIFAEGGLIRQAPGTTLWNMQPSFRVRSSHFQSRIFEFNYHVAAVVFQRRNGVLVEMVLDPQLFNEPVTLERWQNAIRNGYVGHRLAYEAVNFKYTPRYYLDYNDFYNQPKLTGWRNEDLNQMWKALKKMAGDKSALESSKP